MSMIRRLCGISLHSALACGLGLSASALAGSVSAAAGVQQASGVQQPAAQARISEEVLLLDTYPFSDPDPIPILASDPRLYPYHAFRGYSPASEPREWRVVRMENDLIEVFVLPEAGGKVWGAVVKETGHEFIYRNEVMKFRDIALRGPWTSGGVEFNFGVIGHTPATATPVDYTVRENADGSVSTFVGAMDLPSRTHWRVEIRLPADKGYFETHALWYNPTPLEQPYYNWMTAAAFAQDDLELFVPGGSYLEHSGRERPWPLDEAGRFLPLYRNNAFGGNKSYHVVGELNDFFGGYYHDDGYGWGHWARYEDMPGQKMWLWSLARDGGIWEDLLTDTDGQYVEFQAGRLLVQYQPGDHVNPVTQAAFDPISASAWTETWFPLEGTGGLTDASREGAMHVAREDDGASVAVTVQAFGDVTDTLRVWSGDELVAAEPVDLAALRPQRVSFAIDAERPFRVVVPTLDLDYSSDPAIRALDRPFEMDPEAWENTPEADRLVFQARELAKGRRYAQARELFEAAAAQQPWSRGALLGLADLDLRSARYEEGLEHARRALQLDTYDAAANFMAGNLYRALGRDVDAREAFGWAARAVAFRAASYVRLAEIMTGAGKWGEAERYARLALDFDRNSVPAWQLLAALGRLAGDAAAVREAHDALLEIDPLHHFVLAERYLADPTADNAGALTGAMYSEYPDQSLLELAVAYAGWGLRDDAVSVLDVAATATWERPWPQLDGEGGEAGERRRRRCFMRGEAFLADDPGALREPGDVAYAFPFRTETLPVLRWAARHDGHWGWRYLLGLNLWALDRKAEAALAFELLGAEPDYGPAYAARGHLLNEVDGRDPGLDFTRAVELAPNDRILWTTLVRYQLDAGRWAAALESSARAREIFPDDFNLALLQVRALLNLGGYREAIDVLAGTHVLPSENARESHHLYELAHVGAALDEIDGSNHAAARDYLEAALLWPESLGQGRPYDPDERLVRYLLGVVATLADDRRTALQALGAVAGTVGNGSEALGDIGDLLAIAAFEIVGGNPGVALDDAVSTFMSDRQEALRPRADAPPVLEWRLAMRALALADAAAARLER